MSEHHQIIDVKPVEHSSSRINAGRSRASRGEDRQHQAPASEKAWSPASALAGVAQVALGAGLVAIGIPMLVLPGPGLLSIGAGVLLAARGFGKVAGR